MITNPLFSIVTICYNEKNLSKTCESIISQDNKNFEWIVIDGGSRRNVLEVFNAYKDRISYFVSEPDNGVYDAMNKGISVARGIYINFMNAGDEFVYPYVLNAAEYMISHNTGIDVMYGETYGTTVNGESYVSCTPPPNDPEFLYVRPIMHQSAFINRECFKKFGLYDISYKIVADWCFFVKLHMNNCKFLHWKMIVSNYNKPGISADKQLDIIERNHFLAQYFPCLQKIGHPLNVKKNIAGLRKKIMSRGK